jgi:hypothetical protein
MGRIQKIREESSGIERRCAVLGLNLELLRSGGTEEVIGSEVRDHGLVRVDNKVALVRK